MPDTQSRNRWLRGRTPRPIYNSKKVCHDMDDQPGGIMNGLQFGVFLSPRADGIGRLLDNAHAAQEAPEQLRLFAAEVIPMARAATNAASPSA